MTLQGSINTFFLCRNVENDCSQIQKMAKTNPRQNTWSESSQVEHQAQQNQPGEGGGTVVVCPVGVILHQAGVGAPAGHRDTNLCLSCFTGWLNSICNTDGPNLKPIYTLYNIYYSVIFPKSTHCVAS